MNAKYFILLFSISFTSCHIKKKEIDKTVIPVISAMGSGKILNLSEYAKDIRYIPLETNDSVLIKHITQCIYVDNRIVINDNRDICWLFDTNGKFISALGKKGNGPNEYLTVKKISTIYNENKIILDLRPKKIQIYDLEGKLINQFKYPSTLNSGDGIASVVYLSPNTYFADIVSYHNMRNRGLAFETKNDTAKILTIYPTFTNIVKRSENYSITFEECAWLGQYKGEFRFCKPLNDTIFTMSTDFQLKKKYVFDFGKYKLPVKYLIEKESDKEFIALKDISESSNYLFMRLRMFNCAPESFEFIANEAGLTFRHVNNHVCAVFEKSTGDLTLLNQAKKKKLGFFNDIDGGPFFWPKYISSDEKMIAYFTAEDFLEYYSEMETPSQAVSALVRKLKIDDNPVLMVVSLKK